MADLAAGRPRWIRIFALGAVLLVLMAALLVALIMGMDDPEPLVPGLRLPDRLAFTLHADTARALHRLGAPPETVGIQWVKAASHARGYGRYSDQVSVAAEGIRAARPPVGESAYFDTSMCAMVRHGSNSMQGAVEQAGIRCSESPTFFSHVPEGSVIPYDSRPPIGGPHYDKWYPSYGVVDHPILPGYWVHNLEHGAIVLLYNCPQGCPDLVAQTQALYPDLPAGRNAPSSAPRLLALPYQDMDHRLAVVAWDHLLELDQFDRGVIVAFYQRYLDRGPECIDLHCPQ